MDVFHRLIASSSQGFGRLLDLLLLNRISFLKTFEKYKVSEYFYKRKDSVYTALHAMTAHSWAQLLGRRVLPRSWDIDTLRGIVRGVNTDLVWIAEKKGVVYTIDHPSYPHVLRNIADPPLILFIKGAYMEALRRSNIAIVGTRRPNGEGRKASFNMGYHLANQGVNVVSGLARGIDIQSHLGVLESFKSEEKSKKGIPIAVLGTPIDYIYPRAHLTYITQMLSCGGLVLSEYPPYGDIYRHNFISRNRIISGLSSDVVVIQAPSKSGALATASFALEQGRNVWVHEVGIKKRKGYTNEVYEFGGTRALFEQGAKPIKECGRELFENYH